MSRRIEVAGFLDGGAYTVSTMKINFHFLSILLSGYIVGLTAYSAEPVKEAPHTPPGNAPMKAPETPPVPTKPATVHYATFGGGCFWCVEAFFEEMKGVKAVISGYTGGHVPNPTYKQITRGDTGHAEVIRIEYDPAQIEFSKLLDIFFKVHDPTTLNRQGADVGTQYRSAIFYQDEQQKVEAEAAKIRAASFYSDPIVTEIVPAQIFYPAEDYHQDYFQKNPYAPYSMFIRSKMKKLEPTLKSLKEESP